MKKHLVPAILLTAYLGAPLAAANTEIQLQLPVRAKVDLTNRHTLASLPFLVVSQEGESGKESIDIQKEFDRYMLKLLRRETPLRIVESGPVDYPTYDLDQLAKDRDFWRAIGERAQADLLLAGSIDFEVQNKSGYRVEEYVSPTDGRTYYRQALVEQTGFEYDVFLAVYDGHTGEQLYSDNFKDFKQSDGNNMNSLQGMFQNLTSLEDRILNVFTQKHVEARRILLSD